MTKPRKQTVDYFPHDTDASDRKTLTILEHEFGNDGYAFWFKLLELLGKSEGHFYVYRTPIEWKSLLAKTRVSEVLGEKILETLAVCGYVDRRLYETKCIWCEYFVENIADAYKRRNIGVPVKPDYQEQLSKYCGENDDDNP